MRFLYLVTIFCLVACAHAPVSAATPRSQPPPTHPVSPPPSAVVLTPAWELPDFLDAINRQRRVVGAPALRIDRGLCAVAERATAAYQRLGRGNEKEVDKLLKRDLEGLALTFERTKTAVATIEELRHAPQQLLRAAMDPSMAYAGIVIGPPPPPVAPRGGYSVVLALGR